jgi:hypothetical protein
VKNSETGGNAAAHGIYIELEFTYLMQKYLTPVSVTETSHLNTEVK